MPQARGIGLAAVKHSPPEPAPTLAAWPAPEGGGSREPYRGNFVGRADEMTSVLAEIAQGGRLITVRGFGGVGKTRLAHRILGELPATFRHRWLCELAEARSQRDVLAIVAASVFGVSLSSRSTDAAAARRLEESFAAAGKAALVLDNLEQLGPEARQFIARWLSSAPELVVIATSRVKLGLAGEWILELAPLPVHAAHGDSDALRLLLERARLSGIRLQASDRATCEQIACLLEGIPLAIEMASARLAVLTPAELLGRLSRPFARALLTTAHTADAHTRHTSLTRVLRDSWELLSGSERSALAACGVFVGGFTLEALEAVGAVDDAVAILQRLVDSSLLRRSVSAAGQVRFAPYEVVREFALEQLEATATLESTQSRHARFFASRARAPLRSLADDDANLEAAARFLRSRPMCRERLAILVAMTPVRMLRGPLDQWVADLTEEGAAAGASGFPDLFAQVEVALARALHELGRTAEARAQYERAIASAASAGDRTLVGLSRVQLGRLLAGTGAWAQACAHFEAVSDDREVQAEVRKLARACLEFYGIELGRSTDAMGAISEYISVFSQEDDPREASFWLVQLGRVESELEREEEQAVVHFDQALALSRALGDAYGVGFALFARGVHFVGHGQPGQAMSDLEQSTVRLREAGTQRYLGWSLGFWGLGQACLGLRVAARGSLSEAIDTLRAVDDGPRAAHFLAFRAAVAALDDDLVAARADLDDATRALPAASAYHLWTHRLCEAQVELALARQALARGDVDGARTHIAAPAAILEALRWPEDGAPPARADWPWKTEFFEPRIAATLLADALRALRSKLLGTAGDGVLRIARDGSALVLPDGSQVVCPGRGKLQRILAALAEARQRTPGEVVAASTLVRAGWPDERLDAESAQNRLHVALDSLRKLGLRPFLLRGSGGWLLAPSVPVRWEGA